MDAVINVYTYKEGLLSKLAHDLKLAVTRFHVSALGTEVMARFDPASLVVQGTMKNGHVEFEQLSASDKAKITEHMTQDVLRVREHSEARFNGRTSGKTAPFVIEGALSLCGETRPLTLKLVQRDGRLLGELELKPSEWGVKPFRAFGGTLKVQDRVRITIDASAEWMVNGAEPNRAVELVWTPRESKRPPARSLPPR